MAKASKKVDALITEHVEFEDYATEIQIIAERVMSDHGRLRDRVLIRQTVEKHVAAEEKKNKGKMPTNRRQVVERGLSVGVTKVLEAWDFVQASGAWPPDKA